MKKLFSALTALVFASTMSFAEAEVDIETETEVEIDAETIDIESEREIEVESEAIELEIKHEVSVEIDKERIADAMEKRTVRDLETEEYELGKSIIDVHGYRVRIEEHISRPKPNQIKLLVINERDHRTDMMIQLATFKYDLPPKLPKMRDVWREMFGNTEKPRNWLTEHSVEWTNETDHIQSIVNFGDPVKIEGTLEYMTKDGDLVTHEICFWIPSSFKHIHRIWGPDYDKVKKYAEGPQISDLNGDGKYDLTELSRAMEGFDLRFPGENLTGVDYYDENDLTSVKEDPSVFPDLQVSFPHGYDKAHVKTKVTFKDGTWAILDHYVIDNEGNIYTWAEILAQKITIREEGKESDIAEAIIENVNFEHIFTLSEFKGRDIDVVTAPEIFAQIKKDTEDKYEDVCEELEQSDIDH